MALPSVTHLPGGRRAGAARLALVVFLTIAGFLLVAEHQAHVLSVLPYALLLACPLLHLFLHRGHGHGGHR